MVSSRKKLRVCLLQFASQGEISKTLNHLEELVTEAVAQHQPHVIALPECFNFEYCTEPSIINAMAESISDGATCRRLSELSKKLGIFIVGGSIVEREGNNLYNTSTVWNPSGELVAKFRKAHLCDHHLEGGMDVVEVGILSPGDDIVTFQLNGIKCGIAICYDAWFDEFMKLYGRAGCDVIFIPAASLASVGPQYWELIHRARAVDNQVFVAVISPARNDNASYVVYGHSMIIDPNGTILSQAGISEEIVFYEIDLGAAERVRKEEPIMKHRRIDIYKKYYEH